MTFFTLVASTNPCPCGYFGDPIQTCTCHPRQREQYWAKLSGLLMDRIDLQVAVKRNMRRYNFFLLTIAYNIVNQCCFCVLDNTESNARKRAKIIHNINVAGQKLS